LMKPTTVERTDTLLQDQCEMHDQSRHHLCYLWSQNIAGKIHRLFYGLRSTTILPTHRVDECESEVLRKVLPDVSEPCYIKRPPRQHKAAEAEMCFLPALDKSSKACSSLIEIIATSNTPTQVITGTCPVSFWVVALQIIGLNYAQALPDRLTLQGLYSGDISSGSGLTPKFQQRKAVLQRDRILILVLTCSDFKIA
jgi:hypothetical protein